MRNFDFSPLYRSAIGFDRLANLIESAASNGNAGYPPYNIERSDEDHYRITIAVADQDGSAPQVVATVPHETRALLKQLKKLGASGQVRCCYEAGPTGFGLCRALNAAGIECIVVAPSLPRCVN